MTEPMHECQGCGKELRAMTGFERQDIVWHPYSYVFWCRECAGLVRKLHDD